MNYARKMMISAAVFFGLIFACSFMAALVFGADTYTTGYGFRLPDLDIEDEVTPWGEKYNTNFTLADAAIKAVALSTGTLALSSGTLAAETAALRVSTGVLQADLATEVSNRQIGDAALGVSTGTNYSAINSTAIALTAETAARVAADAAIAVSTTALVKKGGDTMTGSLIFDPASISTGNITFQGAYPHSIMFNNASGASNQFLGEVQFLQNSTGKHRIITYGDTHATYPKEMQIGADATSAGTNVRITGGPTMTPDLFVSSWTSVGVNTANPNSAYKLDVNGDIRGTNYYGTGSGLSGVATSAQLTSTAAALTAETASRISGDLAVGVDTGTLRADYVTLAASTGPLVDYANWNTAYGWGNHALGGYVTYTGAVADVALGTHAISASSLTLVGTVDTDLQIRVPSNKHPSLSLFAGDVQMFKVEALDTPSYTDITGVNTDGMRFSESSSYEFKTTGSYSELMIKNSSVTINTATGGVDPLYRLSVNGSAYMSSLQTDALTVSSLTMTGPLTVPNLAVSGFSVFGSTNLITHISTAPGNVIINGALEVSSDVYITGRSTFTGNAFFGSTITVSAITASSITVSYVRGLSAPTSDDAPATKAYVDASLLDQCALGSALPSDIVLGKSADINCDNYAEVGTLATQTLSVSTDEVKNGVYAATWLSAEDADLAEGNIKSGTVIFGVTGTLATAPPAPGVGGTWLLVPGDSSLGTRDFYVQKYEAKNVFSLPTSNAAGFPWVSISQTDAKRYCTALGAGYHLLTMEEAQTISRNIEQVAGNWTGGSVGSGGLWRGHSDNSPGNSLEADVDSSSYTGTGNVYPSIEKRTLQLSSGDTIWDWSGNVWEWVDMTCVGGTGSGLWDATAAWQEWSAAAFDDYERGRAGPSSTAYTSAKNAGQYYGCTATANAVLRGGDWDDDAYAGVFAFYAGSAPSDVGTSFGFRCGR